MSLDVAPALLGQARAGEIDEIKFVETVRTSLPCAYHLVASLVGAVSGTRPGSRPARPA